MSPLSIGVVSMKFSTRMIWLKCHSYSNQVDTAGETAKGGAFGVAVGASIGAILGNGHDAERGAGAGAVVGGAKGFGKAEQRKEKVLYRCMKSRGYRVFG